MTPTTSRDSPLYLEHFSRDYVLVHGVDVVDAPSERPEMDWALLETLEHAMAGDVVGKVGSGHYVFEASSTIPSKTAAVPGLTHDTQLLLLK